MTFTPPAAQDLTGKVALVTGTTSGLGKRFAQILANAGASVVITGRRVDRLEALAAELEGMGARVLPVALDVTDVASIDACVAEVVTELGGIDILINNAGMNVQASAVDLLPEDFDRVMATRVGARMIARGQGGSIINVASIGAHTVLPGLATYCMSKAAVAMMTRSLAHEWARHKINVNAICPGFIETELNSEWFETDGGQKQIKSWPRRRLGLESDLDGIVLLLASEQGRLMTGSVTTIDDGQSL